jgi:hypothetical protein
MTITLQQVIDERVSFLKEQINANNKPELNSAFQQQIDAIRSVDDFEQIEVIILQRKTQLKNCKDIQEFEQLSVELEALEWLHGQIQRYQ